MPSSSRLSGLMQERRMVPASALRARPCPAMARAAIMRCTASTCIPPRCPLWDVLAKSVFLPLGRLISLSLSLSLGLCERERERVCVCVCVCVCEREREREEQTDRESERERERERERVYVCNSSVALHYNSSCMTYANPVSSCRGRTCKGLNY